MNRVLNNILKLFTYPYTHSFDFLKFYMYLFYVYECFICIYDCASLVCLVPVEIKESIGFPTTRFKVYILGIIPGSSVRKTSAFKC